MKVTILCITKMTIFGGNIPLPARLPLHLSKTNMSPRNVKLWQEEVTYLDPMNLCNDDYRRHNNYHKISPCQCVVW